MFCKVMQFKVKVDRNVLTLEYPNKSKENL